MLGFVVGGMLTGMVPGLPLAAQGFEPVGRGVVESIDTSKPVSAQSILVGLTLVKAADGTRKRRARQHLWVRCREACSGTIEVVGASATGRYELRGPFTGSAAGGRWVRLPLAPAPRAVAAARQNIPDDQLATVAWMTDPANRRAGARPLLTAWTDGLDPPAGDTMLVALGGDADMALRTASGQRIACRPTSARAPTSFSRVCLAPLAGIGDGRLFIDRREGSSTRSVPFQIK